MRSQRVKPTEYLANPNLREAIRRQELAGLYKVLPQLAPKIPFSKFTIEGFDISNLAGTAAVGAKVSFTRGEPNKRSYRRYKIKTVRGISDTAMMQEVLQRRLQSKGDQPLPHLILVDGGKGQVSKALAVLKNLDLGIPLIGLAKGKETIVYYTGEGFSKLRLPRDHPALQLLQRVRDEAHRFGLSYHHKIRLQPIG